jgi:hypothetical protein
MSNRRNVTIVLDDETARWARIEAARRDTSVSRFVGDLLRERMDEGAAYKTAAERFMSRRPYLAPVAERRLPTRDELHERGPR